MADVHKAGAIIIQDRKLLFTRTIGKDFFICPGGRPESGETYEQALIRELKEELDIDTTIENLEDFGTYTSTMIEDESKKIYMRVLTVKFWQGNIKPTNEVEEIKWVNSLSVDKGLRGNSIFELEVIPRLKKANLID